MNYHYEELFLIYNSAANVYRMATLIVFSPVHVLLKCLVHLKVYIGITDHKQCGFSITLHNIPSHTFPTLTSFPLSRFLLSASYTIKCTAGLLAKNRDVVVPLHNAHRPSSL